jgi:hypothetical protein
MRFTMHLTFVCFLVSLDLIVPFAGTSWAQGADPVRSATYGKRASKFVSGCEIYLFGEYLDPVEGPDGTKGFLIEKTDSAVALNGRHFYSPHDTPRRPASPPSERAKRLEAIFEEAVAEIRRTVEAHPSIDGAYYIDSILYSNVPQPYRTKSGDTVMLHFILDWGCLSYEDASLEFPLKPEPELSKEERDKRALDNVYLSLAEIRPGFIILIGEGYKLWYPLSEELGLKAALAKIPALAQARYQNIYGEWVYEPLTIDGYEFYGFLVADFAGK